MTTFEKWNWTTILSILVAIELQIGSGQMSLAHMFPSDWIPYITAWSSNLGSIGATVMAVISYGNKRVPGDSLAIRALDRSTLDGIKTGDHINVTTGNASDAAKIVGAILIAFTIMSLAWTAPAFAQAPKFNPDPLKIFTPKPAATASGVNVASFGDALAKFGAGVQTITKEIVDVAIADVQAAFDDATKKNDEISAPCWQAHLNLLKNLPVEWDTPPKMPIGIALGIQIQRDILNTINGTAKGTLKVDCAALYGDELKSLAGVAALLGIRIASGGIL